MTAPPTRTLVLTLDAGGGVGAAREAVIDELRRAGHRIGIAYYATYPKAPELSVPSWRLPLGRPGLRSLTVDGITVHQVGCRLPELEWRHYAPSPLWNEVLAGYEQVVCVSGSVLPAWPAVAAGKPCLAWVGTPYDGDRKDRVRRFPLPRRLVDGLLDAPVCRRLERKLLCQTQVAATGAYCRSALEALVPGCVGAMIPLPIPDDRFAQPIPEARSRGPYRIGFAGRYEDPRKNAGMLLETLALCRARGLDVTLHLVGGEATADLRSQASVLGIGDEVEFAGKIPDAALVAFYRSLDLFVMASHQEGFAIVAAEAMATGCPVVSTRCGGPEEYVVDGVTGRLVGFTTSAMAEAVVELVTDSERNRKLRHGARALIQQRYSMKAFRDAFWSAIPVARPSQVTRNTDSYDEFVRPLVNPASMLSSKTFQ